MKKVIKEYIDVLANIAIGIVFSFSSFLLIINIYHQSDINYTYIKNDLDSNTNKEIRKKLKNIEKNISTYDINAYKGNKDKQSLFFIQSKLKTCVSSINNKKFNTILDKQKLNIVDIYNMQQFYQSNIVNDCIIKEIYDITIDNSKYKSTSLEKIKPFLEDNIDLLKDSTDYVKKVIKDNSNYYYSNRTSKQTLYNNIDDSYYEILTNYTKAVDFIEDFSVWYKDEVGDKNEKSN